MGGRRPIGAVDRIWLNMDRPSNLLVIDAVVFFTEPVDWRRLMPVLATRLVDRFPIFRQRPEPARGPLGAEHWSDDPTFSVRHHIRRAKLRRPGDDDALQRYIEQHMHRPLARDRPLWEIHLIDGYGRGCAMYARFHHAIADGIALATVLLSLTDATPDGDLRDLTADPAPIVARSTAPLSDTHGDVDHTATTARLPSAARFITRPLRAVEPRRVGDVLVQTGRVAEIVNKLLLGRNPPTVLRGEPGVAKRAVWSRPFPLAGVKQLGRLAGATVNDVLVSMVAGAIASYLVDHDGVATDLTTMVPVNMRAPDQPLPAGLGNRFALVMLRLPSSIRPPLARLAETHRRMEAIKHSPEAMLTFGMITAIGRAPLAAERALVDFFADKAIGVTTNVAGPTTARYLAGAKIGGLLAWVPGSGNQTVGICIVTYNRTVRVGFKVDASTVPDPERLVHAFDDEIDMLMRTPRAG